MSGPADPAAEGGAGCVHHLRQIASGDGGHLGLKTGQDKGELLLGGGVGQDGRRRLNAGLWRPGGWSHDGSNRAVAS
ncbi:hypothetical protein KBY71_14380 [Cyanobium sp. T1B-Tous]|uniref:hypothetical protein n=1 Tax=Cyanobium sp. T1B-Tous TaxID=2823721 RepID=UPI0020CE9DC6|nr:hypothetical protein [Cyanobium sp. T1B-Tous]MCP9807698.1 hypothetical protein [Cyanobium sp. T1B-Tous]